MKYDKIGPEMKEPSTNRKIARNYRIGVSAIVGVIVVALTLGFGFGFGFSNRLSSSEQRVDSLIGRLAMAETEILELAMNISQPQITVLGQGTFDWYFLQGDETIANSVYVIENVRIGPLNFTLLQLSGPTTAYTFPATIATGYRFELQNFDPPLLPYLSQPDESFTLPISVPNVQRMSIANGCLDSGDCYETSELGDATLLGKNQLTFRSVGLTPVTAHKIRGHFYPTAQVEGSQFTLAESWQLLIPHL